MAELSKREFTKSRHGQRRDLYKACQAVTKGTKWKSRTGVLVGERGGWFVGVHEMTDVLQVRTRARVVVKPMAIDPIFWEIVGHPELCRQSLSFRYFGAMTCAFLILEEAELSEEGGVAAIAQRMLDLGNRKLQEIADSWTSDHFLRMLCNPSKPDLKFVTRIATLLADRRFDEAQSLCDESAARGSSGGFLSSKRGTFNEMVTAWIAEQRSVENKPLGA